MVPDKQLGGRAIVIGASMAGLLAARVLSERFGQVWVLDRDELPEGPMTRKGTPQVGHAHGLLAKGRSILEGLFPGITETLCARGAQLGDGGLDVHFLSGGRELARQRSGSGALACSRPLLEDEVRRRVRALPNVQLMTRIDVVEPIFDVTVMRLTGVRIRVGSRSLGGKLIDATLHEHAEHGALAADLVIDCSGRGSRAPQWLAGMGFAAPEEERVTIGMGYVTGYFERKPDQFPACTALIGTANRDLQRPVVLIAQEPEPGQTAQRWVVTFGGYSGDHAEATLAGMRQRALESGADIVTRIVQESPLLGPVARFGFPHSQWRHYERLRRFPERFLVMGDAIASFNPIYGQGMSVAAGEALALRAALTRATSSGFEDIHIPFFRECARMIDTPWRIAVGADLDIAAVTAERKLATRIVNAYLRRVVRAAEVDAKVSLAFRAVTQLVRRPISLLAPGMVWRVLVRGGGATRGAATGDWPLASGQQSNRTM